MAAFKFQSAMEYLMTYGWAILIIAVVLGALFGLGFFNSANLAPKVSAGSCQVYRPDGPGTTTFINTEGNCNNELPQYVASFNSVSHSYVSTGTVGLPLGSSTRSMFTWIYWTGTTTTSYIVFSYGTAVSPEINDLYLFSSSGTEVLYFSYQGTGCVGTTALSNNTWYFVGYTYGGGTSNALTIYLDGNQYHSCNLATALNTVLPNTDPSDIAKAANGGVGYFQGSISNIQIYNASLSANEVTALYDEGIGGVPLNLNSLVGWWPLNGNANDYSGNLNNGVPTGVVYTSSWTSGYTAP